MTHKEQEELLEIARLVYGDNRAGEESSTAGKIYRLINEEYGISRDVEQMSGVIKRYIEKNITNIQPSKIINGHEEYYGDFKMECFGQEMTFICTIYNFNDSNKREVNNINLKCSFNIMKEGMNSLTLRLVSINKQITDKSEGNIQHELHHCYEYVKRGNKKPISNKYEFLYDKVTNEISEDEKMLFRNDEVKWLSTLNAAVYASFNSEINAFLNNLDVTMRNKGKLNGFVGVDNSSTYKSLTLISAVLSNWGIFEPLVERLYGITPNVCYKILKNAEERYHRGIARLINKYRLNEERNTITSMDCQCWYQPWKMIFDGIDDEAKNYIGTINKC